MYSVYNGYCQEDNTYLINKEISKRNTGMCSGVIETRITLIPIDRWEIPATGQPNIVLWKLKER